MAGYYYSSGGSQAMVQATPTGSMLAQILLANDILPGDDISYELCKNLFIYHPLGAKMSESPVRLMQSQERDITVARGPEDECVEAFTEAWEEMQLSRVILNLMTQARIYGIAAVSLLDGQDTTQPVDMTDLWRRDLVFNVLDPLNTAGSLVTSQDPNSPEYQKWGDITVAGTRYHRSRTMTFMNEESLYIAWSQAAFGFTGRSVYQRALYPMKSFLQTMVTDDMVTRKAGLLVARMEQAGSIVDRVMQAMFGVKRNILREAQTNNVISIGTNEIIETVNLRNVNDSMDASRNNIIKNIATAADMPAKLLTQESFVEGFGEGTQDAYAVAQYIDRMRVESRPCYRWADEICMRRAWSPEFYEGIQQLYPDEYSSVPYATAFYKWRKGFKAAWPNLIKEKPSEAVGVEDIKMKAVVAAVQVLSPMMDPENRAQLVQWAVDQFNINEQLFSGGALLLDRGKLQDYIQEQAERAPPAQLAQEEGGDHPPPPFSARDAAEVSSLLESQMRRRSAAHVA